MSDQDRPDLHSTPAPEDRPQPGSATIEGPANVYDRPERTGGGMAMGIIALIVLALVVFLLVQFVF